MRLEFILIAPPVLKLVQYGHITKTNDHKSATHENHGLQELSDRSLIALQIT